MTTTPPIETVQVLHRTGQWCPGRRIGEVAAYDVRILPEYQVPGRSTVDRSYLLLDQGIQLTRPAAFEDPVEGWWYVDLVDIEPTEASLVVHDLYVDFLVPPGADRYHVLDLDELADALSLDPPTRIVGSGVELGPGGLPWPMCWEVRCQASS